MRHFNIYDEPDLIVAINYSVSSDYFCKLFTLENNINPENIHCCSSWLDIFCCLGSYLTVKKYNKEKLIFANDADTALKNFAQEIPNIEFLDLLYHEPKYSRSQTKYRTFWWTDVPDMINYIISAFENSTTLKYLSLSHMSCHPLESVIAIKIIKMHGLEQVRIHERDGGFAEIMKKLLSKKKFLLLQKLLGLEVNNDELGVNEIELSPLKDLVELHLNTISIIGEYLSHEDIGIGPEIICK